MMTCLITTYQQRAQNIRQTLKTFGQNVCDLVSIGKNKSYFGTSTMRNSNKRDLKCLTAFIKAGLQT